MGNMLGAMAALQQNEKCAPLRCGAKPGPMHSIDRAYVCCLIASLRAGADEFKGQTSPRATWATC